MPRRAAVLLAAALVLGAAPSWAQAQKMNPMDERAWQLRDLAEQAYALNLADDHTAAEPALREVVQGWRALGWGDTEATRATVLLWAWSLVELGRFDEAESELAAVIAAPSAAETQVAYAWGLMAKM